MSDKITNFTHLHLHTPYSLLDGFAKIDRVLDKAAELGMKACAITDHGVMFGAVEFYKEAKKRGIKPIMGCEVYTAARTRFDKEAVLDRRSGHLILLAKNKKGYQNLIKLVSAAHTQGYYFRPRIDVELLREHSDGLIALSACLAGDVQRLLLADKYDEALQKAGEFDGIFGKDNFYLEMQDHGIKEQKRVNLYLRKLSKDAGIPLVITNDVHYVDKSDSKAHEVLLCIQTGKKLSDADKMEFQTNEFYFKSKEQMQEIFPNDIEALENTNKIAEMCNFDFEFGKYHLPKYDVPEGYSAETYLKKLCQDGIKKRYEDIDEKIQTRLDYELSVINTMGFTEYFLIVWDFINYAKTNKIPVGPGRGSSAGSLVAYSLGITDIDPLKYDLLFERFLNPERVSMPDIDVDFCYERRKEVIDYVKRKYGEDHVSQITAFDRMKAKAAIKDCARVMDFSIDFANKLSKEIPVRQNQPLSIKQSLEENKDLKARYDNEIQVKQLLDTAMTIENLPRNVTKHAAGVLIAAEPVDNFVPLYESTKYPDVMAQFEMTTLEELGLLKMDFLGLRTLTVIQKTLDRIKEDKGIDIDLDKIDYGDQKVFSMISSGNTLGLFQFENAGVTDLVKKMKPTCIQDLIAATSLYRPGPMEFRDKYLENRNDESKIVYDDEKLIPILKETKGVLIYQEQVMRIVRDLAGYSYAGADLVRRAMSKKKMGAMQKEKQKFIHGDEKEGIRGCVNSGISEQAATRLFDEMTDFANYAFNKSHAAAYSTVAYQTAYLKAYYPAEFMASLMTSYIGFSESEKKIVPCKIDCEENGIQVLPPDVNHSSEKFEVEDGNLRYPLSAIKGVGTESARAIAEERSKNGAYRSFEELARRLDSQNFNKRVAEALIKSGAFDNISHSRADIMARYEDVMASVSADKKSSISGQMNFFDEDKFSGFEFEDRAKIKEFRKEILLAQEKEALGFYISGNPLDKYDGVIKKFTNTDSFKIKDYGKDVLEVISKNDIKSVICILTQKKIITDKRGNMMAFLQVEDRYSGFEAIVFASAYDKCKDYLTENAVLYIKGRISVGDDVDENKLIADDIRLADDFLGRRKIYLRIKDLHSSDKPNYLKKFVHSNGNASLIYVDEKTNIPYGHEKQNIYYSDELIEELKKICGKDNVKVV